MVRAEQRKLKSTPRDPELEAAFQTLAKLGPGVRHCYHEGLHAHGVWCRAAMRASDVGLGHLTQKRVEPANGGPAYFLYYFTKSREVKK